MERETELDLLLTPSLNDREFWFFEKLLDTVKARFACKVRFQIDASALALIEEIERRGGRFQVSLEPPAVQFHRGRTPKRLLAQVRHNRGTVYQTVIGLWLFRRWRPGKDEMVQ